ncbi:MAG: transcription antitermination factor NusB [Verrucomicrobiota bacterium]
MRSIKFSLSKKQITGWDAAAILMETYLSAGAKADQVLGQLPEDFIGERRAGCQSLFLGALRHGHRARAAFSPMLRKPARPLVEAILLVASYEFLSEPPERHPKIVHHAVERSKRLVNRFEQGFLNAVLRKLPNALSAISVESNPADYHSHPNWLVKRWTMEFGHENTAALLNWNQRIPEKYIKLYQEPDIIPTSLQATEWKNFYRILPTADWKAEIEPLLNQGTAYIKDPSTRLAPEILAPNPGDNVLDLCAAPGGKAYDLAHLMKRKGRIVAVDLPGNRINHLRENLKNLEQKGLKPGLLEHDVRELEESIFTENNLPGSYDCVMLDAPCSNTGVIQRRTDVKWRLNERDIKQCAALQLELLTKASKFVKAGARLVYSTCSIETQENEKVVEQFLSSEAGVEFKKVGAVTSRPWETGHDGAGAFLLERV